MRFGPQCSFIQSWILGCITLAHTRNYFQQIFLLPNKKLRSIQYEYLSLRSFHFKRPYSVSGLHTTQQVILHSCKSSHQHRMLTTKSVNHKRRLCFIETAAAVSLPQGHYFSCHEMYLRNAVCTYATTCLYHISACITIKEIVITQRLFNIHPSELHTCVLRFSYRTSGPFYTCVI